MFTEYDIPRHPVIWSEKDWCVESPPQHSILVPLPFSECDWIPRDIHLEFQTASSLWLFQMDGSKYLHGKSWEMVV